MEGMASFLQNEKHIYAVLGQKCRMIDKKSLKKYLKGSGKSVAFLRERM